LPAVSISQKRLFSMAYAYKKGTLRLSDIPKNLRSIIKRLASQMTLRQLRDFAKTKEKGLPYHKRRRKRRR